MADTKGLEELQRKLQAIGEAAAGESLGKALLAGGFVLEGKIKILMGAEKHGRTYGRHTASAPGEAPAIDIGALVNSIYVRVVEATPVRAEVQVGTNMVYATPLEFGAAHLAARPFMRPAVDENPDEIGEAVRVNMARLIEQAAG
jgi:HK97 gp10 family phage protein